MSGRSNKNILIAAGGTGGHVFPAQALARQLQEKEYEVLFMGKGLSTNAYFSKDLFASLSIDSASPFRKNLLGKMFSIFSLGRGVLQAFRHMKEFRPELVVGFGSFHAFPVLAAAFLQRVPIVLFESNSVPGKVNRLFSRCSLFCGVQFPKAKEQLKGTCHEVKMPFWAEKKEGLTKKEALQYFSLEENRFTILVFGGSQGAAFINPIIAKALREQHQKSPLQVIHMTGSERAAQEMQEIYQAAGIRASVKPFEKKMHFAWTAADLVISRAGAATLSEVLEFEVPAILIPYPTATDQHQLKNALFVTEEIKGAFCIQEKNLSSNELLSLISTCNVEEMKRSIQIFKTNTQKRQLIDYIEEALVKT